MKEKKIDFVKCQSDNFLIGRDQHCEGDVRAPNGYPLSLIAVISFELIAEILKGQIDEQAIDKTQKMYFFSYYDPDDYYLDYISYHGTKEEFDFINEGYVQTKTSGEHEYKFNKQLFYSIKTSEFNHGMSFMGGEPKFLQNEDYSALDDYYFIGQILGMDLPEDLADLFYLHENIAYFYVKKDLTKGLFFVQST